MSIEYVELTIQDAEPINITISDIPESAPGGGLTPIAANSLLGNDTNATALPTAIPFGSLFGVGNKLFVDAETGDDTTGAIDGSKPYLTITAAKSAASNGDTIVVRPGNYTVAESILKNGVNWYFEPGTFVSAISTASVIGDSGTPVVSDIDGFATFSAFSEHTIYIQHPSSVVTIRCKKIENTSDGNFNNSKAGIVVSAGIVNVVCDSVECESYDNVLTLNDGINTPYIFIQANRLKPGSVGDAIECNKGKIVAIVNRIDAAGDIGIWASDGVIFSIVNDLDPACDIVEDGGVVKVINHSLLSEVSFTGSYNSLSDIPLSFNPSSHAHGNISNAGAIGSSPNLPLITAAGGVITTGSFGTGANTFCQGNDSRLSDSREWIASTIDQAEAEAGIATTRRAWTAQRVRQAIAALAIGNTFETVSQSLSALPQTITYSSGRISTIVYTLPNNSTITKTINYTGDKVTSVVLSGATPSGIQLTKTLTYTGDNITEVSYS